MIRTTIPLLLVDDEPWNLEILEEYLEGGSYQLHTARDGEEAWAFLTDPTQPRPSAILLDRMMPKLDGLGVLTRLRARHDLAQIPVILQTADAAPERVAEGIQAGAFYYLTKPFQRSVLLSVVASALEHRARIEEVQDRLENGVRGACLLDEATFRFRTPSEAKSLATLLSQACPVPDVAALGLWELLINAVEHGNLEITYAEKSRLLEENGLEGEIQARLTGPAFGARHARVTFQRSPEALEITITDEGPGFDWQRYVDLDPSRAFHSHGRGIAMTRQLSFPEVSYRGRGNEVALRVPLVGTRQEHAS